MLFRRSNFLSATLVSGLIFTVLQSQPALKAADTTKEKQNSPSYQEIILADKPVVYWDFENGTSPYVSDSGVQLQQQVTGNVQVGKPGPLPERFPLFSRDNKAILFDGKHGLIDIDDPGDKSILDFHKGDSLTLEAWVQLKSLANGRYAYIIGKGRTGNKGFARENQNYAFRLQANGSLACLSFLFRNEDNRPGASEDFHRWTSSTGILPGSGWHHVAVSYSFGKKGSIKGYVDGKPVTGKWEYGGDTDKGPVVDNDQLRIGSSQAGSSGITFNGSLDEIAIYRSALSPERIKARYKAIPPKPYITTMPLPENQVLVEIQEKISSHNSWNFVPPKPVERYIEPAFGFVDVPQKYSEKGFRLERSNPFVMRATALVKLPKGKHQILVRSRTGARLFVDDKQIISMPFHKISGSAHGRVRDVAKIKEPHIRLLQTGDNEDVVVFESPGKTHRFRFEIFVGGNRKRPELGETCVALRKEGDKGTFRLLSPAAHIPLTEEGWHHHRVSRHQALAEADQMNRQKAAVGETDYWNKRHEIARNAIEQSPAPEIPAVKDESLVQNEIDRFINARLDVQKLKPAGLVNDNEFLRRISLDLIGTVPTPGQINAFRNDQSPDRRVRLIDRLLEHPGWADHWVAYWQDALAENPNILKPTLNNTGPFRWALREAFLDNKSFDRFTTELIMMEGDKNVGAFSGFGMAAQNDVPMAAKAHIIGQAFLGLEMKCARCHDAPFHNFKQQDLFSMAAMLKRGPQGVPKTSSIPLSDEALESLIVTVSIRPGAQIKPAWPFPEISPTKISEGILRNPADSRERLAALITSPQNKRFAQVTVNRLWQRYMGRGLVESVDDWENETASHPELLDFLARKFVLGNYDLKQIARLILNSHTYQRTSVSEESVSREEPYHFAAPLRRRFTAEQLVDSLFVVSGKYLNAGELNMDLDGALPYSSFLNLGNPHHAWQFTSLSNERDRPSLAMPYTQDFVSLLKAFGWRAARQNPLTIRDHDPTVLQPAALANGVVGRRITRLSDDSAFTELALEKQPVEKLVDQIFLRMLTRLPDHEEQEMFVELLQAGYKKRRIEVDPSKVKKRFRRPTGVSWSNHLSPEANRIKIEMEALVEKGDLPSIRLQTDWRERMEDMIWTLMNSPEFIFIP